MTKGVETFIFNLLSLIKGLYQRLKNTVELLSDVS